MDEIIPEKKTSENVSLVYHYSFFHVHEKIQKWLARFTQSIDSSILKDLQLVYLLASNKYLDHRTYSHLFRLVMSIYLMQKKLLQRATFASQERHIEMRWLNATLHFPFSSHSVLGCIIAFNTLDKHEFFDEENFILALEKSVPELRLVKESLYYHQSQHKNLKICYFEIEKKDGIPFSLQDRLLLKNNIEEKVKNTIKIFSPNSFNEHNEEELYKTILVLSREIQYEQDLPQASISIERPSGNEIVFRIILVYILPFHHFSLKDCFRNCTFVSQRILTVKQLEDHPVEAHIFHLHLPKDVSLMKTDGSFNFYAARQKITQIIKNAIGEFRDYNGGIIVKQHELFQSFKENFPEIANQEPETLETFFYALTPIEKQAVLSVEVLSKLFNYFLENRAQELTKETPYFFKAYFHEQQIFLSAYANHSFAKAVISFIKEQIFNLLNTAYNFIEVKEGIFFNFAFLQPLNADLESFLGLFKQTLSQCHQKLKNKQILTIGLEYNPTSLDPRIGGEDASNEILKLVFEGLTRYNQYGTIENGMAQSIEISSDGKEYIFKLRSAFWNDGSSVTAQDFEYAWKKILSPNFKTSFAYFFYPIKNAKEAKQGLVSSDHIGVHALDDRTLRVELVHPALYFLQYTAHSIYSPVHRLIDKQFPQWPHECEKNYPCNGPFQLQVNQPDQGYQLIKNPFYWDTNNIKLDQINFKRISFPQAAFQAFQQKEIDWIGHPFGGYYSCYIPTHDSRTISITNIVCWLVLNTNTPPFNHRKLRHAFAYAIQRDPIIENNFLSLTAAYSPLLMHHRKSKKTLFPEYNIEMARQLFNEALIELDLKSADLSLSLTYHEKGSQAYIAPHLQRQFKECFGIDIEMKRLPWNKIFENTIQGDFQILLQHWSSKINDPIYTFNTFRSKDGFPNWEHPDFQKAIDLAEEEIDYFKRAIYFQQAEEILHREVPVIPLFYQPYQALIHENLHFTNKQTPAYFFNIARGFYHKEV